MQRPSLSFVAVASLVVIALGSFLLLRRNVEQPSDPETIRIKSVKRDAAKIEQNNKSGKSRREKDRSNLATATDPISKAIISMLDFGEDIEKEKQLTSDILAILKQMTEDQRKAVKMRVYLDRGNKREAMRLARDLMDSEDPQVRHHVVSALGWIGPSALSELTAMLADQDMGIAHEAMEQWQNAFDEIQFEAEKAEVLVDLLPTFTEREQMDLALMTVTRMRQENALDALSEIIDANRGTKVEEAALDMWDHMTGDISTGEKVGYKNADSVQEYLDLKRHEQEDASNLWRQIAEAIAAGDDATARTLMGLDLEPADGQSEKQ